ncbi:DNA-binding NtrC family response regulator [Natronocella acetinitrilica]|uniref:DNA-binding NtrC family response regulator n=1 Tax=Natronocella acetinitrilica TaxID=414046 RepID=A0AAE3G417_9GAMM|nr:sigma-54 dependent transcriptional regulator [Natronocella acetinitrilica]MCP1674699.1 DNA-binding NtrC family response regulator [Natronocella acetinitrilica]
MDDSAPGVEPFVDAQKAIYFGSQSDAEPWLQTIRASGWTITIAKTEQDLRKQLRRHNFQVGLVTLTNDARDIWDRMADEPGLLGLTEWVALVPSSDVTRPEVQQAIVRHFYDFHTLPVQGNRLLITIGRANGMVCLQTGINGDTRPQRYRMVGRSDCMRRLQKVIQRAAATNAPVLITGESGTGKELAAQALHEQSMRRQGPMIAVNCGALTSALVRSELFGYEQGAFLGAEKRTIGKIEAANGGTLFLDEVGDLPLEQQVNLLRFLQSGAIQRIGGHESIPVDVRVVAATHVNLEEAIAEGRFREDLYYRLNVLHVPVPTLRERGLDILSLAHYFFKRFRSEGQPRLKGFSVRAEESMLRHPWPGNVRELINRVRRAIVMADGRTISSADLGIEERAGDRLPTLQEARERAEKEALMLVLAYSSDNLSRAARLLDVSRLTLYRMLDKHCLRESAGSSDVGKDRQSTG